MERFCRIFVVLSLFVLGTFGSASTASAKYSLKILSYTTPESGVALIGLRYVSSDVSNFRALARRVSWNFAFELRKKYESFKDVHIITHLGRYSQDYTFTSGDPQVNSASFPTLHIFADLSAIDSESFSGLGLQLQGVLAAADFTTSNQSQRVDLSAETDVLNDALVLAAPLLFTYEDTTEIFFDAYRSSDISQPPLQEFKISYQRTAK